MKNIAIFWDFDNTHLAILEYYGSQEEPHIKLINKLFEEYSDDKIRIFRAYADFEKIKKTQSEIQKNKVTPKHVFSSNSGSDNRKNASDIELCLDALEVAITNKEIDEFVIISADKDMIPLLNRLNFYGKQVHFIHLESALSDDKLVLNFADKNTSIESLIELSTKDPNNLSVDELKAGSIDAIELTEEFYQRNEEKQHLFFGKPIFKEEMIQKKGYSGEVAEKILVYCLENDILNLENLGGKKVKLTVNKEV